jgi:hypothetical protein
MPTSFHGYQRVLIRGIPAWKKDGILYYYDMDVVSNPLVIGSVSEGFKESVRDICAEQVVAFRSKIEVRKRSAGTSAKKK